MELEGGDLTWAVDVRLTYEVTVVTANLSASHYDEPYQTLVRDLGGAELGVDVEGLQQLNLIVDELLDDLSRTLKSASLLELHRQSVNKPFFPNL
ncbi:hypothetical protein HNQ09_002659 [Deinococcus budaensis]|uniref:Uncharacterized protein n=1 Tax=Deinococcus budaensis TaxID=1665626 RepID=A0A7W8LR24_9DEIO|nr:hypothetical protein [Deinococcus budaensis]